VGRARFAVVVFFLALTPALAVSTPAHADGRATAEELFQRGRQAMEKKEFPRACELLEASLKLEDTLGTLLNVALCHEAMGRVASAWGEFRAVEQRALRSVPPQTGRVEFARQHAEALQPKVSRLKMTLDPKIDARSVEVRVDGALLVTEALSEGTPVDPGKRVVRVSAPGKRPAELPVDVPNGPSTTIPLTIPALVDAPAAPAPAGATSLQDAEAVASARARRTAGYVTGGIGLAFVAAGAVFGALALNKRSESACAETTVRGVSGCFTQRADGKPNPELDRANQAYDDAVVFANLSTGAFILGAIGAGVGMYLILTAKTSAPSTGVRAITPRPFGLGATF
jgi:hypothetical protein